MSSSIMGRAVRSGCLSFGTVNPRDFTYDRNSKVDDVPFGGEPGMLLRAEPVARAIESIRRSGAAIVLTDPAGHPFRQTDAVSLGSYAQIIFLCGHYEGIDERLAQAYATHRFSIGDYVLTNGELPALVMADAIVRRLPGVLGSEESLEADSFGEPKLSAPNFTRPETWRGREVPPVLRSGHHEEIEKWRRRESASITNVRRPDLRAQGEIELPPRPKRSR